MDDYIEFRIPKRNGGYRFIEAPCDTLKARQRSLLKVLEDNYKLSYFCNSKKSRNIITNAVSHVGNKVVFKMDIQNFYNSITYEEFRRIVKPVIDLAICFRKKDGKQYLTQGSPTSPFLANLYLVKFDWLIAGFCAKYHVNYSRYVDDLAFSGDNSKAVRHCVCVARHVLLSVYKLKVNPAKNRILYCSQRQRICGVVVNQKINPSKRERKCLRLLRFLKDKKGVELSPQQRGYLSYYSCFRKTYHIKSNVVLLPEIHDRNRMIQKLSRN